MKIYVVAQGMYSSYHVITATLDKALAEEIAKKFDSEYENTYIEEYADAEVFLKPCWFVCFDHDGSVVQANNVSYEAYHYEDLNKCNPNSKGLSVSVLADDSEAAIKIAAEKRAQHLAERAGIT